MKTAQGKHINLHQMRRRAIVAAILTAALTFSLTTCAPPLSRNIQNVADMMDAMAANQAEFGTIAVSSPILSEPGDVFQFNLNEGPEDFYSDAKNNIQGAASEFQQEITSSGLGVNFSLSPTLASAYSAQLQQYQAAIAKAKQPASSGSTTPTPSDALNSFLVNSLQNANNEADATSRAQAIQDAINTYAALALTASQPPPGKSTPTFPAASFPATAPANIVVPTTLPSTVFANSPSGQLFAAFQQLSNSQRPLSLTDRTALITAAGDAAVKSMFEIMGNPGAAGRFKDKRVLFGVSTVSVNPGWRTSKNYAAIVAVVTRYTWEIARPGILSDFVKDAKIPADLRVRLAVDQDLPIPDDREAMEVVFRQLPYLVAKAANDPRMPKGDAIRYWNENIQEYQSVIDRPMLSQRLAGVEIPSNYEVKPFHGEGPEVAAVSPLTDIQTLDLTNSSRQQQQVALNLAFALQLAGLNAQASAFLNYAKSLEQDVSTLTPDVTANSVSDGIKFGFEVGPTLRAIQRVKAGHFSGPGLALERQSFPALVIYGFDEAKIAPRVTTDGHGKFILKEPNVEFDNENNWVPLDEHGKRLTETERLQMQYWKLSAFDRARSELTIDGMHDIVAVRADTLGPVGNAQITFALPESVVYPRRQPVVTRVEPTHIELPPPLQKKRVAIVLEGDNLDTVELEKIRLISGGQLIENGADAPRRVGTTISTHVELDASDDPAPIVFALPTAHGGTYSPTIRPFSGSVPEVLAVAPQVISLDVNTGADKSRPFECDVFIVGHNFDLVDWKAVHPVDGVGVSSKPYPTNNKNVLREHITFLPAADGAAAIPAQALAFALPRPNGQAVYTPPVTVFNKTLSAVVRTGRQGDTVNQTVPSPGGIGHTSVVAPSQLDAKQTLKYNQVELTWTPTNAASYTVYYRTATESLYHKISGIAAPYEIVPGLSANVTYKFAVAAADSNGAESALIEKDLPIGDATVVISDAPSSLIHPSNVAPTPGDGQVTLRWNKLANSTVYDIDYGDVNTIGNTPAGGNIKITNVTGTTETIPGLINGMTYYFRIQTSASSPSLLAFITATIGPQRAGSGAASVQGTPDKAAANSSTKVDDGGTARLQFSPGIDPMVLKDLISSTTMPAADKAPTDKTGNAAGVQATLTVTPSGPNAATGNRANTGQ